MEANVAQQGRQAVVVLELAGKGHKPLPSQQRPAAVLKYMQQISPGRLLPPRSAKVKQRCQKWRADADASQSAAPSALAATFPAAWRIYANPSQGPAQSGSSSMARRKDDGQTDEDLHATRSRLELLTFQTLRENEVKVASRKLRDARIIYCPASRFRIPDQLKVFRDKTR